MDLSYRGELNGDKWNKRKLFYLNADERRCVCICIYTHIFFLKKDSKEVETRHIKIGLHLANSTSPKGTQMVGADPLLIEGIVLKLSEIRSLQSGKRGKPGSYCDFGQR